MLPLARFSDFEDPGALEVDAATLDAHFRHPNFTATGQALRAEPRLGGAALKYRIDACEPVKGPDGNATATFTSTEAGGP